MYIHGLAERKRRVIDGEKANPSIINIYDVSFDSSSICSCKENFNLFLQYLAKIYDEPTANKEKLFHWRLKV